MQEVGKRHDLNPGDRTAILLEFIAATAILGIVAVVLYMIFTYRPV